MEENEEEKCKNHSRIRLRSNARMIRNREDKKIMKLRRRRRNRRR